MEPKEALDTIARLVTGIPPGAPTRPLTDAETRAIAALFGCCLAVRGMPEAA